MRLNRLRQSGTLRHIAFVWFVITVCFVAVGTAWAQTGTTLRYGDSVTGRLSATTPLSVYQFDGRAGDSIRASVVSSTRGFQVRLALLSASMSQLALSNAGERVSIGHQLPQTGVYYLVVTGVDGVTGSFTLTLGQDTRTPTATLPAQETVGTAPQAEQYVVTASPVDSVVFSEAISRPLGNIADLIEVRFPASLTAEPQTYRFTLTCEGTNTFLVTWAEINACEGSFEQVITLAEPGLVPVLALPVTFYDSDLPASVAYTLTIAPVTPYVSRADSALAPVVDVYSDRVTTFSSTLSRPTGTQAHQVTLRFPNLINSQPQTFRYTLTCDDQYADLYPWLDGDYGDRLGWFGTQRCGSSVTETIQPANLTPFTGFEVWIMSDTLPIYFHYTLTIEPITPLLAVATPDSDHIVNVPVTGVSSFTQAVSAPLGDVSDRITVRAPALGGGGAWDFVFNLLCAGTGQEAIEWTVFTGQVLGCGDSFSHRLEGTVSAPIPAVDMVVSLGGQTNPAHIQYTLLITPAGLPAAAPAPSDFVVSLTGQSLHSGALAAGNASAFTNVSVAGLVAGYPRTIVFNLACSGANLTSARATLAGLAGDFGCGETFQRVFSTPGEQAQFAIVRTQTGTSLTYLLTAAPLYSPVASPDTDPQPLLLQPAEAVTFSNTISSPEGDTSDTILLDARQIRASALPQQYTVRMACEGAISSFVRGFTETGLAFGCGGSFAHTFGADQASRTPASQDSREGTLPLQPGTQTDPLTLPVHISLAPDAASGLVSYVLFVEPTGLDVPPSEEVLIAEYITASSSQVTTFTRPLTDDRHIHRLNVSFPDLAQAHWQDFDFRLTCSGVGTGAVRWRDMFGVLRTCNGSFRQRFEVTSDGVPGITMDVLLDNPGGGAIALEYTLYIEPASPYVPIVPEDSTIYQLAIALNQPTTFSQRLSSPSGDRLTQISAAVFEMIGGQAAGRNFTFWLECDGPNAEVTTASGSFDGFPAGYQPFTLLCNVPVTRYIDEGAGSPPRLYIEVMMPQVIVPAYNHYTLHIVPAGADMPFDPLPPTATPTPFLLQAITIAPTITPTRTLTPTPLPIPELIAPANGAVFDTQPVTLTWTALPGDPRYEVEVQRCNLQATVCTTEVIIAAGSSYALPLSQTTRVIWRVRAILPDGSLTGYSSSREFLVFLATPTPSWTPTPTLSVLQQMPTPLPIPGAPVVPLVTMTPSVTATESAALTPTPPRETSIPVASPDRDHSLVLRAGAVARFSDAVSHPDGDTADIITITVEGLGRQSVMYTVSLTCAGTGIEALRWAVRGGSDGLRCGGALSVPFAAGANTQAITIAFDVRAPRSYVTYTLNIAPR